MTERRDFIRKSIIGTAGIAVGSMGFSCKFSTSTPTVDVKSLKDWHTDPEWNKIKYGDWGGPGVSAEPGPMDAIRVKDYAPRSSVVSRETHVPKAKYPVIDCHVHVVAKTPEEVADWVRTMDEVGMEKSIVLTGETGAAFDALVDSLPKAYPGRFLLYCGLDRTDIDKSDYSDRAVAELVRCHNNGARGVGELSDKGFGFTEDALPRDKRLHPDDPRLDAFWEKCAELKMPVNLHVADHPSCWTPLDVYQERTPDYQHFNQYGKDVPSYDELITIRNRTLESHPKTIFIACHLGNQGNDLEKLSLAMDRYPNLCLDTSARDYELGRTPRASAKFLTKYQNRILFGTDQSREKSMYQIHWRLFETDDEYIVGRVWWRYYGLELPGPVLESLYRGTAMKIFNI
ncbi:MAG TPA: amidohydrolase family protein [Prolixibacteraceae bacterium]|nr:amidohydrolase family protein [Prolixibacteraceae bacterium]